MHKFEMRQQDKMGIGLTNKCVLRFLETKSVGRSKRNPGWVHAKVDGRGAQE